mgnify:CR=1 FL=1
MTFCDYLVNRFPTEVGMCVIDSLTGLISLFSAEDPVEDTCQDTCQDYELLDDCESLAEDPKVDDGESLAATDHLPAPTPTLVIRDHYRNGVPMILDRFRSKAERICAQTLMTIFDQPFISVRPDWLRNPLTGRCLELDCYNAELKLAVEYNGLQHYKAGYFGMDAEDLKAQKARDAAKFSACVKKGVYLIVVSCRVPYEDIPAYIVGRIPDRLRHRLV